MGRRAVRVEAEEVFRGEYRYPLALPVFGAPVPGKVNPYLVIVSSDPLVSIRVSVLEPPERGAPSVSVAGVRLGWRFELAVKSFVDALSSRLEEPLALRLEVGVDGVSYPPAAPVYAAASLSIVSAVSEAAGYSLEPGEALEAASGIDRDAAVWLDYLDGLRRALLEARSMVYRWGEDPVPLGAGSAAELELVGEEDIGQDYSRRFGDPVLSAASRLAGVSVLGLATGLQRGETLFNEAFEEAARVDDALFYMLYGAQPAGEGCKWTPSLQRVYGVCLPGRGMGDRVAFTL